MADMRSTRFDPAVIALLPVAGCDGEALAAPDSMGLLLLVAYAAWLWRRRRM